MPFWKWSQSAASNGTADSTCPFPEGMAPSAVNDGTRGMMAALAMYRDDIAGAIVTSGSSTAYTVASYSGYDSLAHMNGAMIAFTPHATNGATVTLNVDGLGAKPLRSAQGVELLAGTLIQTAPYLALYNNTDAAWYLHGFYASQFNVPLGSCLPFFASNVPNSSFAFPAGQAVSRTTYATLFAIFSTQYGSGDGSTTFNLPDLRGRTPAMIEASASRLTSTYFGGNSTSLGATGGGESQGLITANLPAYTPAGSITVVSTASNIGQTSGPTDNFASIAGSGQFDNWGRGTVTSTGSLSGTAQGGTSAPFRTVQPTMVCNYILRII